MHDIKAVRVQAGHAEKLRHALDKHHDHRDGDATDLLVESPAVDEDSAGDDDDDVRKGGLETVFGDTNAVAVGDGFLRAVVDPAATNETTDQVTRTGHKVE